MRMIKNEDLNNEQFQNFKITTYHLGEEANGSSNGRKYDLSSKQGKKNYEFDAITIIKYYENKGNEKTKQLTSRKFKIVQQSRKNSVPGSVTKFLT